MATYAFFQWDPRLLVEIDEEAWTPYVVDARGALDHELYVACMTTVRVLHASAPLWHHVERDTVHALQDVFLPFAHRLALGPEAFRRATWALGEASPSADSLVLRALAYLVSAEGGEWPRGHLPLLDRPQCLSTWEWWLRIHGTDLLAGVCQLLLALMYAGEHRSRAFDKVVADLTVRLTRFAAMLTLYDAAATAAGAPPEVNIARTGGNRV